MDIKRIKKIKRRVLILLKDGKGLGRAGSTGHDVRQMKEKEKEREAYNKTGNSYVTCIKIEKEEEDNEFL